MGMPWGSAPKIIPSKPKPAPARKYPTGKVGGTMGHSAPVDTTGMGPEMIAALGIKRRQQGK